MFFHHGGGSPEPSIYLLSAAALVTVRNPLCPHQLKSFVQSNHVLSCRPPERLREHQPHHVGGQPAAGVGPLRLAADQADLQPAGEGVEGFRGGAGRAQHAAGHVGQLPPKV